MESTTLDATVFDRIIEILNKKKETEPDNDQLLNILHDWKEDHWEMFAAKTLENNTTKRLWCNMSGKYRVVISTDKKEREVYTGTNQRLACETWNNITEKNYPPTEC